MPDRVQRRWIVHVDKPNWERLQELEVWAPTLEDAVERVLLDSEDDRDRLVLVREAPQNREEEQ